MAEIRHEGSKPTNPEGSFLLATYELHLHASTAMTDEQGEALYEELHDEIEESMRAVAERINERHGDRLTQLTVVA